MSLTSFSTNAPARFQSPALLVMVLLAAVSTSCISAHRTPNLERIFTEARMRTGKPPVIVIPGILGSELINSKTGEKVWPSAFRTSEEGLPMSPDLSSNRDDLVPGKIIETVRLARVLPEVYVYRDLLEALRRYAGYREGDWNNPGSDGGSDTFYVFAYDWRRDNVANAIQLTHQIERLKNELHQPELKFNIIAHSMGGLIARYAALYGDQDLPKDDSLPQPTWAGAPNISKIVMIGSPNEGSADAFATLVAGYSITEGLRRRVPLLNKLSAEDAVRTPSVFQLLPHTGTVRFLDENLNVIPIDLYDPAVWKKYAWTPLFEESFRRRYANHQSGGTNSVQGRDGDLDEYLAATLKRTRQFHRALDAAIGLNQPVALLAIGGDCEETLNSPVIVRDPKENRWLTLIRPREFRTTAGEKISKSRVTEAMYAPGDGRVTRKSLLGETVLNVDGQEKPISLPLTYAVFGCDLHGQLQRNKTLQDNALTVLIGEVLN